MVFLRIKYWNLNSKNVFFLCLEYKALTCFDSYFNCAFYNEYCDGGILNGLPFYMVCKKTCGKCKGIKGSIKFYSTIFCPSLLIG